MRGVRTHALHATPTSPSSSQHLLKTSARPVLRAARSRPNSGEHPLPCLPLPPPSWASTFPPFIRSLPSSCLRRRVRRPRSPTLQSSRREQGRCSVVRPPMPLSGLDTLLHAMDHLARPRGGAGGGASPSAARSPHVRWVDWRVATAGGSPPAATLSRPSSACPPRAAATLGQDAGDGYGWTTPPSCGDRDIAGNSSPVTPGVDDAPVRRGVFPIGGVAGATPAGSPPSSIASNDWPQRPAVVDATATCGGAAYGGGSSGGGWAAPPSAAILPPWDAAAPAAAAGRAPVPPPPPPVRALWDDQDEPVAHRRPRHRRGRGQRTRRERRPADAALHALQRVWHQAPTAGAVGGRRGGGRKGLRPGDRRGRSKPRRRRRRLRQLAATRRGRRRRARRHGGRRSRVLPVGLLPRRRLPRGLPTRHRLPPHRNAPAIWPRHGAVWHVRGRRPPARGGQARVRAAAPGRGEPPVAPSRGGGGRGSLYQPPGARRGGSGRRGGHGGGGRRGGRGQRPPVGGAPAAATRGGRIGVTDGGGAGVGRPRRWWRGWCLAGGAPLGRG